MQHIKVTFGINGEEQSAMLIAMLADAGYDGFEESGTQLLAYIEEQKFNADDLNQVALISGATYTTETIPAQNWNALWESNFEPVVVDGFCTIRADFHNIAINTPYEIIITPKMSFGTGHHATTQLMMRLMKDTTLKGAKVLDFGTGTGVLAILAEMLGAARTLAIDNDAWCVENSQENIARNNCVHITVRQASLEHITADEYDVILANINRHILLEHMNALYGRLKSGGTILMSGLLTDDENIIKQAATVAGFHVNNMLQQAGWIAISMGK